MGFLAESHQAGKLPLCVLQHAVHPLDAKNFHLPVRLLSVARGTVVHQKASPAACLVRHVGAGRYARHTPCVKAEI